MKREACAVLVGIAVWMGLSGAPDEVRAEAAAPVYLKPVLVHSLPDGVQVVLSFQGKGGTVVRLDEKAVSYGEGWTQIQIPGVVLDPPKQSQRLDRGPLTEVFAYQFTPEAVRVRLYHRDPPFDGRDRVSLKPAADGAVVTVADRPLPKRDPFAPSGVSRKAAVSAAEPAKGPAVISAKSPEPAAAVELPAVPPPSESVPAKPVSTENLVLPGKKSDPSPAFAVGGGSPDLLSTSLKMVLALTLVLLLMGGCVYVFKRTLGRRMGLSGKDRHIRILSSAYLGPKKNIVLVEVAGETLVLGVSGDRISLLSRVVPEVAGLGESAAPPAVPAPEETGGDPRFERMLRSIGGDKVTLGDDLWTSKES